MSQYDIAILTYIIYKLHISNVEKCNQIYHRVADQEKLTAVHSYPPKSLPCRVLRNHCVLQLKTYHICNIVFMQTMLLSTKASKQSTGANKSEDMKKCLTL